MKRLLHSFGGTMALFLSLLLFTMPPLPAAQTVTVSVDPRVELMSIIFRLAGNPEYNQGKVPEYIQDIDYHFAKFKNHPVVKMAAKLRATRGVSFDAVMDMAVHVSDAFRLEEAAPFAPLPESMDKRWTPEAAREFLAQAREFVVATKFQSFVEKHQPLYRLTAARMEEMLAKHGHLEWFDAFFGVKKNAEFRVVPGLVNGGACYGVHLDRPGGQGEIYSIIGVWSVDPQAGPVFNETLMPTIVHEFNHSYTNALVDRFAEQLQPAGEKILPRVAREMVNQAYPDWKTMMYESLDRACVLRYILAYNGAAAMAKAAQSEEGRSFYWVGEMASLLGEYDTRVRRYPDLAAFFPRIISFFTEYADNVDSKIAAITEKKKKKMEEWREKGPKIVSIFPADGASNVDPNLKTITITFDRPMRDKSWAVMIVGDKEHHPASAGPAGYDKECRIFTIPVKLKPGWEYAFGLNHEEAIGFVSSDGVPLYPVIVRFKTGK